ncbi:MAG: SIMPL domain-containing protein [Pseudomonadota bacterium]
MLKRILLATLALTPAALIAAPALAQTPPATIGQQYIPAPWWMRDPVIASVGYVRVEIPANRAAFSGTFQNVERTAADASRAAANRVRALSQTLAEYGADKVRVETTISTRPLYDQYRDENGVLRDNVRSDRIERYQADATVSITIRDVSVLERVYATVLASSPTSVGQVYFNLQPENETLNLLAGEAVKDSASRARAAAENAGARLGPVRVIDPTGRACQTDVLAGWPSYGAGVSDATNVDYEDVVVTGSRMSRAPSPPPPPPPAAPGAAPSEDQIEAARLALQPPLRELTSQACVVYGLN